MKLFPLFIVLVVAVTHAEDTVILQEDFSDPATFSTEWTPYGFLASGITESNRIGTPVAGAKARPDWWRVEEGRLVGTRFPEEGHPSGIKRRFDPVEGDVRLSFRFRIPKEGKIGFAIQGDNPVLERRFNIAGGAVNRAQVIAWDNDVLVPKDSPEAQKMEEAGKWNRKFFYAQVEKRVVESDVWHDFAAELRGGTLTLFLNGQEVLRYETVTGDVAKRSFTLSTDSYGKPEFPVECEFDDLKLEHLKPQVLAEFHPEGEPRAHIVMVGGEEFNRSEEFLPQFAKILAKHHQIRTTLLFSQDPDRPGIVNPNFRTHIPGLETLSDADLLILSIRFRELPNEQMERIEDYLQTGRPVFGFRTAMHGFKFPKNSRWFHWTQQHVAPGEPWHRGIGGEVFGNWFVAHHGHHAHESTKGIIEPGVKDHPILRGIEPRSLWAASDVYAVEEPILGDDLVLLARGQVLEGMTPNDSPVGPGPYDHRVGKYLSEGSNDKNDPLQAWAWVKTYQVPQGERGKVFNTTLGASQDFLSEGTRRLCVNGVLWCLDLDIPKRSKVGLVGNYAPSPMKKFSGAYWIEKEIALQELTR